MNKFNGGNLFDMSKDSKRKKKVEIGKLKPTKA